jgi:diaminobutyrate-2-oxoglutarate transaminase
MNPPSLPDIFERRESKVRSYCRSFPRVFKKAKGPFLYDVSGRRYIDFFCGAGALNYGHNDDAINRVICDYLQSDGIIHSLDMATCAKQRFLERFEATILIPRDLDYKVQFVGPTGTNAIEAALKLARKVKRRSNVIAFTNGYHGLSSGSLAITANSFYRHEAFVSRLNVSFMPFDGYLGSGIDTMEYLRRFLEDESSGVDTPAAIVVETVQSEGGVNIAGALWLQSLQNLCREHGILLVVDDIQVGCGRTGAFFSFERAGIRPDIVTLSKSISASGLPMSIVLLRPELDHWRPGEHSGTFRGNNLAFISATEALAHWAENSFAQGIAAKSAVIQERLGRIAETFPELGAQVRGVGLIYGFEIAEPALAEAVVREAFRQGLIIELCGGRRNVLKFLPPLTIPAEVLEEGLTLLELSIRLTLGVSANDECSSSVLPAMPAVSIRR